MAAVVEVVVVVVLLFVLVELGVALKLMLLYRPDLDERDVEEVKLMLGVSLL